MIRTVLVEVEFVIVIAFGKHERRIMQNRTPWRKAQADCARDACRAIMLDIKQIAIYRLMRLASAP
jgi:hypothetical protein